MCGHLNHISSEPLGRNLELVETEREEMKSLAAKGEIRVQLSLAEIFRTTETEVR